MNGTQLLITITYAVLVVACIVITARLIRSTRPEEQEDVDTARLAHRETGWAWLAVVLLVALLASTIFSIPYGNKSEAKVTQHVRVTGLQFAWVMKPAVVRQDEPVEFTFTSNDVNHGFGLYRGHRLEFQVQIMPGHRQRVVHTFHTPGTYTVLCLEFCGLDHHLMQSRLQVR